MLRPPGGQKINTKKEKSSGKNSVQEYLDNQEQPSTEKLEIPTSETLSDEDKSEKKNEDL